VTFGGEACWGYGVVGKNSIAEGVKMGLDERVNEWETNKRIQKVKRPDYSRLAVNGLLKMVVLKSFRITAV
jgi:hypothetical protein